MRAEYDLTGNVFGELTVISSAGSDDRGRSVWRCRCSCGAARKVYGTDLRAGRVKSCGKHSRAKDPYSRKRIYWVWHGMKSRCTNPNAASYVNYGGRGITVCKEWSESFTAFRIWAYANGYDENAPRGACTLDRIDADGNYCPENCRWVGMDVQGANRSKFASNRHEEFMLNKILIHVYGDQSHCQFQYTAPEEY